MESLTKEQSSICLGVYFYNNITVAKKLPLLVGYNCKFAIITQHFNL